MTSSPRYAKPRKHVAIIGSRSRGTVSQVGRSIAASSPTPIVVTRNDPISAVVSQIPQLTSEEMSRRMSQTVAPRGRRRTSQTFIISEPQSGPEPEPIPVTGGSGSGSDNDGDDKTPPATTTAKAKKPKRIAIKDQPLDMLYAAPKITPTVLKAILMKDNFDDINMRYCTKVCTLPCKMKAPGLQKNILRETDVLIIQDNPPQDEKYKTSRQLQALHNDQFASLIMPFIGNMNYRVLNLMKCTPMHHVEKGKVKKVTYTQRMRCSPYMYTEIRAAKPKVIISTSTEVTKSLGIQKSNYDNRGEFHMSNSPALGGPEDQVPVLLTLHPKILNMIRQTASGAMYGQDYYDVLRRDTFKAIQIAKGVYGPVEDLRAHCMAVASDQVLVTKSLSEVKYWTDFIRGLPANTVISWDLETTSLDAWSSDARIITSQFGFRREDGKIQAIVVPLWHRCNNFFDPDDAWEYVASILEDPNIPKVGHNVKFDIVFAEVTTGIRTQNIPFDTMLIAHSMNSGIQGNYSLKTIIWDLMPESGLGGYENLLEYDEDTLADAVARAEEIDAEKARKEEAAKK